MSGSASVPEPEDYPLAAYGGWPAVPEVFLAFFLLGLTSFGGPIAHLGYFRREFVERRKWLSDQAFGDLVALCQFLPGPASSQVGMGIGLARAGIPGALAAWSAFTLPSASALVIFGLTFAGTDPGNSAFWLHGLKVVAVAVVAQALLAMGRSLCPDWPRVGIAMGGAVVASMLPGTLGQMIVIAGGALLGRVIFSAAPDPSVPPLPIRLEKKIGLAFLGAWAGLLLALPILSLGTKNRAVDMFAGFFRAGALVFGGGHVVLPLLQSLVVPAGWVSESRFLAGYGAAQAVPGPLFSFAAYLGAVSAASPSGWLGAVLALFAIFLPGFLLVIGALPFWKALRKNPSVRTAMLGVNAAVVGLLLAAFCHPVWTSAIFNAADSALAAACFLALVFWKAPSWLVVLAASAASGLGWH